MGGWRAGGGRVGGGSTLWGDLRGFLGWAASLSVQLPGWMLEPIWTAGIVLGSVSEDSSGNKCKKKKSPLKDPKLFFIIYL